MSLSPTFAERVKTTLNDVTATHAARVKYRVLMRRVAAGQYQAGDHAVTKHTAIAAGYTPDDVQADRDALERIRGSAIKAHAAYERSADALDTLDLAVGAGASPSLAGSLHEQFTKEYAAWHRANADTENLMAQSRRLY